MYTLCTADDWRISLLTYPNPQSPLIRQPLVQYDQQLLYVFDELKTRNFNTQSVKPKKPFSKTKHPLALFVDTSLL